MKAILIGLLGVTLPACASNYAKYYSPVPDLTPEVIASNRVAPPPTVPLVEHTTIPDRGPYVRRGYVPIGYSSFYSIHNETEQGAIAQGQKVGADLVVIVNPSYSGSVTSHVPITTPTTSTSHTSGSATAIGSGGTATAFGNSTTTTYGSQTSYVPMTVNRYDYGAAYFVKWRFILGAIWRDLTDDERTTLQSNSGVYIESVANDTPAFRSDVLAGDILVKIDGVAVYGKQAASDMMTQKRGQEVELALVRRGQLIEKRVRLAK